MFYSPNPRADRKRSTLNIIGRYLLNMTFTGNTTITMPTSGTLLSNSVADQTIAGGANVTSLSQSTGSINVDCGARPLQYITNNGAWTITAPTSDGSCVILITNGASAATPTFSGFSVGSNTGDALDNTNGHKFMLFIVRINGNSTYTVKALQ